MVWRYLQEAGFELAAFALEKIASCLHYESETSSAIISKIEPGCLVNLVQKGILFSLAEEEAERDKDDTDGSKLSLFGALLSDHLELDTSSEEKEEVSKRFLLKAEAKLNGTHEDEDVEMKDETSNDNQSDSNHENQIQNDLAEPEDSQMIPKSFTTQSLQPIITYGQSLTSEWHPSTSVFAYGKSNSSAVINAIKDGAIAESVTLVHPNILNLKNEINIVSWAPQGNLIITAGINGELRAWSPDGKLRNIANLLSDDIPVSASDVEPIERTSSVITNVLWNENGQLLLSLDSNNQVSLWDGNTLSLIKQINPPVAPADNISVITACWLNEDKFALSTVKNSIKIYSITPQQFGSLNQLDVQTIGFLHGHENSISLLKLNNKSKLLASCSDYDYLIKVWIRGSSQESLDLNTTKDETSKLHTSPIVALEWLEGFDDVSTLLSVSMEGILNIWNCSTGETIKSSDLFSYKDNFKLDSDDDFHHSHDLLVFDASLSPNQEYLALADDLGRVTVWDVSLSRYSKNDPRDFVRCLAVYNFQIPDHVDNDDTKVGICDVKWDNESSNISVSYSGADSVVLKWK